MYRVSSENKNVNTLCSILKRSFDILLYLKIETKHVIFYNNNNNNIIIKTFFNESAY